MQIQVQKGSPAAPFFLLSLRTTVPNSSAVSGLVSPACEQAASLRLGG
jgi:hypothetical protein